MLKLTEEKARQHKQELLNIIHNLLHTLPLRKQIILHLYCGGMTFRAIAKLFGVTFQCIFAAYKESIQQLKEKYNYLLKNEL